MTTCTHCAQHQARAQAGLPWGGYHMACLQCCARLVASARPLRRCQEAMLAAIARHEGAPSRWQVLAVVKSTNKAKG